MYNDDTVVIRSLKHRSPGITAIYNELKSQRALRILDLGSSSAQTFNFFRQLSCQIHFEGLDEFLASAKSTALSEQEFKELLQNYLTEFLPDQKFDVILAWDLFNYFDIEMVHWLLERLSPHCRESTLIHSIGYVAQQIPGLPRHFHIQNQYDTLADTGSALAQRRYNKFSSVTLMKGLPQFHIEHSYLNFKGMLPGFIEQLMRYQPGRKSFNKRQSSDELNAEHYHYKQAGKLHSSAALKLVYQNLRAKESADILDLGRRNRHNHDIYYQMSPNIYAEDLHRQITLQKNAGKIPSINRLLTNLGEVKHFDAIFLWDLLNFLSDELIRELFNSLEPYTGRDTLIHAVVYSGKAVPAQPQQFHIRDESAIEIFGAGEQTQQASLTSSKMLKAMPCFEFADTFIFRPGMQRGIFEYLVRRRK